MKKFYEIAANVIFWILAVYLFFRIDVLVFKMVNEAIWPFVDAQPVYPLNCFRIFMLKIMPVMLLSFYLFYLVIIPTYFSKSIKTAVLVLMMISGLVIISTASLFWSGLINTECSWNTVITFRGMLVTSCIFGLLGGSMKTFFIWRKSMIEKKRLERQCVANETALLLIKAQLNPHFLFNTINNIDVLIEKDPRKASMYLRKLSEMMRFMLYESNTARIPLSKEIEYINKYLDLQEIRTSNRKFVNMEVSGDTTEKLIAPMILIPFIENAFKYTSNKKIENAVIVHIDLTGTKINFTCKNYVEPPVDINRDGNGLGLQLIKQRLDLIYTGNYEMKTTKEDNWYIVNLEIQLNDH